METDEWVQEEVDPDKVKKAVFQGGDGDLPGRVQAIVRYMLEEAGKMIQLQKYFDDNFRQAGNKNIAWLREAYPKEYQNLLVTRAYCANREVEFKQLWFELNQNGEHNWLAANAWVERVPTDVINRLDSYYRIDPDDIQNYTMEQTSRTWHSGQWLNSH